MDFRILGPVEATAGGAPLRLGGPRQRALLAYLLLHANDAVAAERLLDELWAEPPGGGLAALQTQVSRLRRVVGDRIITAGSGYAIRVEPGELDLDRFRSLLADAGVAASPRDRSHLLREADAVWRGAPLAGLDVPFAAGEAAALEELRVAALEDRIEADLETGLNAELVSELAVLVARYPLRERLRAQQMRALYGSGRQADALEAYRDFRRRLDEELGLEPGPALNELEVAILRHDPALLIAPAVEARTEPAPAPPRASRARRVVVAAALALLAVAGGAVAATLALKRSHAPTRAASAPPAVAAASSPKHSHPVMRATPAARRIHHARRRVVPHVTVKHATPRPAAVPPPTSAKAHTMTTKTTAPKATPPPTQTQPAATDTTAPAAATTTMTDDFSETTPDSRLWNVIGDGTGYTSALQNGELVFTVPADATPGGNYDMVGPGLASQCRFDGDFDERIDYQVLEWPPGVGAHMQLTAWVFPNANSAAGRMVNQFGDQYNGNIGQHFTLLDTHDRSGTLRLARKDGVETAYYRGDAGWVPIQSGSFKGQAQLGLQLFGMANEWTHQEMQVAFDNFTVTASNVVCP